MNEFMKQIKSINCSYEDEDNYFSKSFYNQYPNKNINHLHFLAMSAPECESASFMIDDLLLVYKYYDCDEVWHEIDYKYQTICDHECILFSFEALLEISVEAIIKMLFGMVNMNDVKKTDGEKISDNTVKYNINSTFACVYTGLYPEDGCNYAIIKNEEEMCNFSIDDNYSPMDEPEFCTSVYAYDSNLIIYSGGDVGNCIVIKNVLK